jgi:hypothetical protein
MKERRQNPRRTVWDEPATMPTSVQVRVLDISVAGVLLQANHSVRPGSSGRLNLNLDGQPFRADVLVRRVVGSDSAAGFRLAATFLELGREDRQLIERYMAQ